MKNIKGIIIYKNVYLNRTTIRKENKNKSGIYMWRNLINNRCYIGSSKSLSSRINVYLSVSSMKKRTKRGSSAIYSALLKHGYTNFELSILEYCDQNKLIIREQYYINTLKPKYNILKIAGYRPINKLKNK